MTTPTFPRLGLRPNPMYGLRYRSLCDRYELYESDQLGGVALDPVRWIAVRLDGPGEAGRVIGRHRCRQAAERRCVQDARRLAMIERRRSREEKAKERARAAKLRQRRRKRRLAAS
jgi:hypothetical protein